MSANGHELLPPLVGDNSSRPPACTCRSGVDLQVPAGALGEQNISASTTMDSTKFQLVSIRQDITEHSLQLKALIQDTNACVGPLAKLNTLNAAGRAKIAELRRFIDAFADIARDARDADLMKELVLNREQLSHAMDAFKRANIQAMLAIEQATKEDLMRPRDPESAALRHRQQRREKEELVKVTSSVTDQMLSISRQLAETTKKSAATLDSLVVSSDSVTGTQEELKVTSDTITQSGKLLAKYGRRDFTDKILMFFAFAFFVACVLYIVRKRLF